MGKFAAQAERISLNLDRLTNRALRRALRAGLREAVDSTNQDSSNAATHWLLAEGSKSRPGNRAMGTVRDLRETVSEGKKHPAVGKRRDGGSNSAAAAREVLGREDQEVLRRYVHGRTRSTNFYLYHGLPQKSDLGESSNAQQYASNANIREAGLAGARAARRAFFEYLKKGWSTRGGGSDA